MYLPPCCEVRPRNVKQSHWMQRLPVQPCFVVNPAGPAVGKASNPASIGSSRAKENGGCAIGNLRNMGRAKRQGKKKAKDLLGLERRSGRNFCKLSSCRLN